MEIPTGLGELISGYPLAKISWFKTGGPCKGLYIPRNVTDLGQFLKWCHHRQLPYFVMGAGSNLLIRDGGWPGFVIRLGKPFRSCQVLEGSQVYMGAGLPDEQAAKYGAQQGLKNFEFLSTIPGTIGGNLAMNAGCYGMEIQDILVKAQVMDPAGGLHWMTPQDLGYSYRHCSLEPGWIFLGGIFQGEKADPQSIQATLQTLRQKRAQTQPPPHNTGGSTFKNPPGGKRAWEYIAQSGLAGLRYQTAQVSPIHCNFLINCQPGQGSALALEVLGLTVQRKVLKKFKILLDWEIKRIGKREKKP